MAPRKQSKPAIDPHRPRVECFILCDYARSENGKLYIVGGGWDEIVPRNLPLEYESHLALKVVLPWANSLEPVTLRADLTDEKGKSLGDPVFGVDLSAAGVDVATLPKSEGSLVATLLLATGVKMALTAPGRFFLRLVINGEPIAETSFVVSTPPTEGRSTGSTLGSIEGAF